MEPDNLRARVGSRLAAGLLATGWLAVAGTSALAHHSFAPYETEKQISFTGTVTHFQWTNPHVYMRIEGPDENGELRNWLIECANPGILNRIGWKWNMIREGDEVTVVVAPLQNGEPGALLKGVRLADGREFSNGGPAGAATIPFAD
jgi:hypothetical protein